MEVLMLGEACMECTLKGGKRAEKNGEVNSDGGKASVEQRGKRRRLWLMYGIRRYKEGV